MQDLVKKKEDLQQKKLIIKYNNNGRRVNAFCRSIAMPDRTMTTTPVITVTKCPRHFVTDHTYGDLTATFYADKYLRERQYFELCKSLLFNTYLITMSFMITIHQM